MPDYDIALFDRLGEYLVALDDAHTAYLAATKTSHELGDAPQAGAQLRSTLVADAKALIQRGVLDSHALVGLKGPVGYKNAATDLRLLAKVLGDVLPQSNGKSGVTAEELSRAVELHWQIYRLVGERERSLPRARSASNLRQRVFTALLQCYDHVRHGVTALRWRAGDADEIAPPLLGFGVGTRKKGKAADRAAAQTVTADRLTSGSAVAEVAEVSVLGFGALPLVTHGAVRATQTALGRAQPLKRLPSLERIHSLHSLEFEPEE